MAKTTAPAADVAPLPDAQDNAADAAANASTPRTQDPETLGQGEQPPAPPAPEPATESGDTPPEAALPGNDGADPRKVTVKTTGAFMLMDVFSAAHIGETPVEVPYTTFIQDNLDNKRLEEA